MFVHPCSVVVFSPSGGGKTTLILRLIRERAKFFDAHIDEILYFYNIWNEAFSSETEIKFVRDDSIKIPRDGKNRIVVVDDLVQSKEAQERLVSLFLVESHHLSCSVLYASQLIFYNPKLRAVSVNAKVFVLFDSPRNYLSISTLFGQMVYEKKFLKAIYKHATEQEHGFLVINLQKGMSEELRFCSRIFDRFPTFYVPRDFDKPLPLRVSFNGRLEGSAIPASAPRS
jgi:hypothetical protein